MGRYHNAIPWFAVAFGCCVRGAGAEYDSCNNGTVFDIGNGRCDAALNIADCGFDGGDCCPCTCANGPIHSCSDNVFDCQYPGCDDPDDGPCNIPWITDGICDEVNNNALCEYDGGDCCECSCVDANASCAIYYFDCKDPACIDFSIISEFPACTGDWGRIGDGLCDAENNVALCGWDGGDCCPCTCSDESCIFSEFECLDPNAAEERYDCKPPPPAPLPCSADIQRTWVVEDSASARALATVINCSGGSFEVEWRGNVAVQQPIYVVDGTTLTVTGDEVAIVDGQGSTRLFSVMNATLNIAGVNISSGVGFVGGAIVALGSTLTLSRTNFIGNQATSKGGAMFISDGSSMSCNGVSFVSNKANGLGGAVFVSGHSTVSCGGSWFNNSADGTGGGALSLYDYSSFFWGEPASFAHNTATIIGGAIHIFDSSILSWNASTSFVKNNALSGGALAVVGHSVTSWSAPTSFLANGAGFEGGAIFVFTGSSLSWSASSTSFLANKAGFIGGALSIDGSSLSLTGETKGIFRGNLAPSGGAIELHISHIFCSEETTTLFVNNSATVSGGALFFDNNSSAIFDGITSFNGNSATGDDGFESGIGGAIFVHDGSSVFWSQDVEFVGNSAEKIAGALYVANARVSWSGSTRFVGNKAGISGGAVLMWNESHVTWTGDTQFTSNEAARGDGGALGSPGFDSEYNSQGSNLVVNGSTIFVNNTSGANGGALALSEGLNAIFIANAVNFTDNRAEIAGGAVFVSGVGVGLVFTGVSFTSNSAQVGGAVSSVGSGNLKDLTTIESPNPATFDRCRFIDNRAITTGGAIESAAGQDAIFDSVFQGNKAGAGGALRLAGTASLENCSFVENVSNNGGGAAVSNIGLIFSIVNIVFKGNVFNCPRDMFLDFESGNPYEVFCGGCQTTCDDCFYEETLVVPICASALDHSNSSGGTTTLETLSIERGHWRATSSSGKVLSCYNADACRGGVTGTADYCLEGYEGPYCAVCSDGYTAQLGFTCSKCSDKTGGIVVVAVVAAMTALIGLSAVLYMISGQVVGGDRGSFRRLLHNVPLQSVKIVIVAWQILTQFAAVANVTYPGVYQRFLNGLDVFNFDLAWVFSAGCIIDVDFHDRLLIFTITPLAALLFLGGTYVAAVRINRGASEALQIIWNKHVSMVLLLTFLVYSSVSSVLFGTWSCEDLEDGKNYLRADYGIQCDSEKHKAFQAYAGIMVVLYTMGIPAFYGYLLFRNREELRKDEPTRQESPGITAISDLYKPYKPSVFYYEVVECGRRVLLAGVVVFIEPNTAAQIAVTLILAFVFVVISEGLAPYASPWDTWLNRTSHAVVFASMYVALLLKADVSDDGANSQDIFEAVLVTAHASMILAIMVETLVLTCSLKARQRDGRIPRLVDVPLFRRRGPAAATAWEDNPFAGHVFEADRAAVC